MAEEQKPTPSAQLLGNFIKDLSFENIALQNNHELKSAPKFEMNLNVNNKKLKDDIFEVSLNIKIKAADDEVTAFILDIEHAGRFRLNNVEENAVVPFLYIECPRILFPYTRQIVSTTTLNGGFLPLTLDNIDFVTMFQNSVKQAQEQQKTPETN